MIKYTFNNKGNSFKPNIYLTIEEKKEHIGTFEEMIIFLLNSYDKADVSFEGFNIIQMKKIKNLIKEYAVYISKANKKIEDATHIMISKETEFIMLDMPDDKEQIFNIVSLFETIDSVEKSKYGNIIIVSGTAKRFGIMNEYGFYDMENNLMITTEIFESYDSFECVYSKR